MTCLPQPKRRGGGDLIYINRINLFIALQTTNSIRIIETDTNDISTSNIKPN